ncbi:MAG: sugar phosphate nucleotidyltransferase [Candidatus Hydrogenedentes bacterium]|nr:sugar phosphate nucleotidyltransferase [Candidatus Hydrogenedentota bacterium]
MQAIIMAAGQSTRTHPLTLTRPKPLLKVANKPILEHQLDALSGLVDEAVLIVWYRKDMIEHHFGASYNGMPIKYVYQTEQLGTGHAILQCKDVVTGPFIAMNGDDLYDGADLSRLATVPQGALAKHVDDPRMYGIYEVTDDGFAKRIVEKPADVFSNLANAGVYKFQPEIFDILAETPKSERGEIEITSAVQVLAERGSFRVIEMNGFWLPIGYPWHLLSANEYWLENFLAHEILGEVSPHAHINGRVYVAKDAIVRSGAVIDGPAYIGAGASIGPNCFIRPCTTIGNHCKVGHSVEIKNSILFDRAAVPHLSYVGDSVIGERANLGAGTITANFRHDGKNIAATVKGVRVDSGRRKFGAIIGDDVHTGINTSIYPGRMLYPHTVTFPGEAIRKDVPRCAARRNPDCAFTNKLSYWMLRPTWAM